MLDRLVKAGTIILGQKNETGFISLKFANDGSFQATDLNPQAVSGLPVNKPISQKSIDGIAKDLAGEYSNFRSSNNIYIVESALNNYTVTAQKLNLKLVGVRRNHLRNLLLPDYVCIYTMTAEGRKITFNVEFFFLNLMPFSSRIGNLETYAAAKEFAKRADLTKDYNSSYAGSF